MSFNLQIYSDGEDLTADVLNRPLVQLADAVRGIDTAIASATAHETVLRRGVVAGGGAAAGDVLYVDASGAVLPAVARWSGTAGENGEAVPAASSYPMGVLVDNQGTVVTGGLLPGIEARLAMFGSAAPEPGIYYLSGTLAGKVARTPASMAVRVATVDSSGVVTIGPFGVPAGYHSHKSFEVPTGTGWTAQGGEWTYTGNAADDLLASGAADPVIVYSEGGKVVAGDRFRLERDDQGDLVLKASANPAEADSLRIYATLPFPGEQPVVRAVSSDSPRLRAVAENGHVRLSLDPGAPPPTTDPSPVAVGSLLPNGGYTITPVVSGITVDGGGSVVRNLATGECAISVGYADGHALSPEIVSLDGSSVVFVGGQLTYIFPAGRISGVSGSFSVKAPPEGMRWRLYPYIEASGASGGFSGEFSLTPLFSPAADVGTDGNEAAEVAVPTSDVATDLPISVSNGRRRAKRTSDGPVANTAGVLHVTVRTKTAPGVAWKLLRFGAVVKTEEVP